MNCLSQPLSKMMSKSRKFHVNFEGRMAATGSTWQLKRKESQNNSKCYCKGKCFINHQKNRWKPSKSDSYMKTLNDISQKFDNSFPCRTCGQRFKNSILLKEHISAKSHKSIPCTRCKECGQLFDDENDLKLHIANVHKIKRLKNPCNYKCLKCDLGFENEHDLQSHIRGVHGGDDYKCLRCDKGFRNESKLKPHKRDVHEGE